MTAFKQPLAVLEETWLAGLRRNAPRGDEFLAIVKRIMPLMVDYRWRQVEVVFLTLTAAAYNMVWPIATQRFIHMLAGFAKGTRHENGITAAAAGVDGRAFFSHHIESMLLVLSACYILNAVVTLRRTYAANSMNVRVVNRLRERMYAHILALSHCFYSDAKIADIMARLTDDVQNVQQALQQLTNKSFYQITTLIGGVITLIALNESRWQLTVCVLLIVPVFALVYAALRSRNKAASRAQRKRVSQNAVATQETLLAHTTIKAYSLQHSSREMYHHRLAGQAKSALNVAMLGALSDLSEDMVTTLLPSARRSMQQT
jgi:ATP-binding cassette subfamily B protein